MIKVPLLRHQRYKSITTHSPTATPTTECTREKNVDFDTFDGHVMVYYIKPNLQEFIFGPMSRFDHSETILGPFKKLPSWGWTPYQSLYLRKNVGFDTFDAHVMVNYIEPNFEEFIFGPIRVRRFDHSETILGPFKKLPFLRTPDS
jgi:hypothetical protein